MNALQLAIGLLFVFLEISLFCMVGDELEDKVNTQYFNLKYSYPIGILRNAESLGAETQYT